jgi:hypothetical protein
VDLPVPATEPVAEQVSEEVRSHTREDGTLVIEILVDPPCGESSEREIVVCASDGSEHRLEVPDPPPAEENFKPEVQLGESAKAGLRAQPGRDGAVEAIVNVTVKF